MKKGLVLRFDSAALFTVYLRRLVVAYRFILPLLLIASAYPATAGGLIETWTAASTTASSITGDVRFSGDKITFQNGKSLDRKSVVSGKSVSVRVDLGGRRIIKKKTHQLKHTHSTSNIINTTP